MISKTKCNARDKDTTLLSRLLLGLFVFLLIQANLSFSICILQSLVNVYQIMFGIVVCYRIDYYPERFTSFDATLLSLLLVYMLL